MASVRRSTALGLAALALILLLLLARLPAAPPAPHALAARPRLYPAPRPNLPANGTTTARAPDPSPPPTPPPAPDTQRTTLPPPKLSPKPAPAPVPPKLPPKSSNVILTRDMYVAGHERPHPELCPSLGARLRVLILVSSAPAHEHARDAVRLTWGHFAQRSDVAMAFVLGVPPDALRPALDREDALYGDIVIGRSLDSYSNLTLKTLSMLEWADTYCPRAPRLLKTDDDMFINVPRLLSFAGAPLRVNATRTIWGKVLRKSLPKRVPKSKYYIPPAQFPGRVLPDFTTGPAYLVTRDVVRELLDAALPEPYLRLEDVFVTGVLAARLRVRRQHAPEFYNRRVGAHPCAVQRGVAIHMVRYHEQFDMWRKLLDGTTKCTR